MISAAPTAYSAISKNIVNIAFLLPGSRDYAAKDRCCHP
jgi:hypothetical protein